MQEVKAWSLIVLTEVGMFTESKALQNPKVWVASELTEVGMNTEIRP